MPQPASISDQAGQMPLDANFRITTGHFSDDRLEHAIDRALQRLSDRTGYILLRAKASDAPPHGELWLDVAAAGMPVQGTQEDESYTLDVGPQRAVLHAATVVGALRGLETFLQLLDADGKGFYFHTARINDHPRFVWRGLLLDVSRHWQPVANIKRLLDTMAVVKLNVFHWHLSDYQGFRIESRQFPRLHELGSDGLYYTQAEVRDIVAYARERGIRVVPEFDMPSHAHSWLIGYPELASLPGPFTFTHQFGIDSVNLDPTQESTYRFLDTFLGEMTSLFPDRYWHIGGDEVEGSSWDKSPRVQAFMKQNGMKDNGALQAYFNQRLVELLEKHGRRMVGWDEIVRPDLRRDVLVQSWLGPQSLATAAKLGFDSVLSGPYYLDKMERISKQYLADPVPDETHLTAAEAAHILGGEVCVWTELVAQENLDTRVWPASAAIAERFWSPREVRDSDDMYRRLPAISLALEEAGSQHHTAMDAMLRRTGRGEISPEVRQFFGLIEPLRLGAREEARQASQLTPLVAPGDIAIPDPPAARNFSRQIHEFLADPGHAAHRDELTAELRSWQKLGPAIHSLAQRAPLFQDGEETAASLSALGKTGEEAMAWISRAATPPPEWSRQQAALLAHAQIPQGLLRIAVLDAIQELVKAANGGNP
ncbi:MAG: family 20 glycosylhydrolase [Acidobacteria bacterium]|nr:family 20 glycosylhydrolase [Acidobacteriota bacterium]